jgi:hypothetical protein
MTRLDNTELLFKFASRKDDNHENIDLTQDTSSHTKCKELVHIIVPNEQQSM